MGKSEADSCERVSVVVLPDQMRQDLGICLRMKNTSLFLKALPKNGDVVNDSVVHNGN